MDYSINNAGAMVRPSEKTLKFNSFFISCSRIISKSFKGLKNEAIIIERKHERILS